MCCKHDALDLRAIIEPRDNFELTSISQFEDRSVIDTAVERSTYNQHTAVLETGTKVGHHFGQRWFAEIDQVQYIRGAHDVKAILKVAEASR